MSARKPLRTAILGKNRRIVMIYSERSAVGAEGKHLIINVLNEKGDILRHNHLSYDQKAMVFHVAYGWLNEMFPNGRWILALNGPGLTTRQTFHIHGIVPGGLKEVLSLVFNPNNWLKRLRSAIPPSGFIPTPDEYSNIFKIIDEFEMNLKPNEPE